MGISDSNLQKKGCVILPIKVTSHKNQQSFINLVDEIIDAKEKNGNTDTSEIENNLDQLVYKLYGLTDVEIAVVEGKEIKSRSVTSTEVITDEINDEISESEIIENPLQSDYDL